MNGVICGEVSEGQSPAGVPSFPAACIVAWGYFTSGNPIFQWETTFFGKSTAGRGEKLDWKGVAVSLFLGLAIGCGTGFVGTGGGMI